MNMEYDDLQRFANMIYPQNLYDDTDSKNCDYNIENLYDDFMSWVSSFFLINAIG